MKHTFNLSGKITQIPIVNAIPMKCVKEFIKRLKEHSVAGTGKVILISREDLDKLAGNKLI